MANGKAPAQIDVSQAVEVSPASAPVAPLSGKEQAGVNLTWGVLYLIGAFILVLVTILLINEYRAATLARELIQAGRPAEFIQAVETQRAAFRTFWLELTKTILLNVLLPVLTALLGYVFGTTQSAARNQ